MNGEVGAVGIILAATVLFISSVGHAARPATLQGLPLSDSGRRTVRAFLPLVEFALGVSALWMLLVGSVHGQRLTMGAIAVLLGCYSVYVASLRKRRGEDALDCECTVFEEPPSLIGVARAVALAAIGAALVVWPPGVGLFDGWVWPAGLTGGILVTYVPTIWNTELAAYLRLQQEHEFTGSENFG